MQLPFIPKKFINQELLSRLPELCGVGIVQKELFKKGIVIAHEGILVKGTEFIHASKFAGKVVREDFYRYTRKLRLEDRKPVCDGVVFYLMKELKIQNPLQYESN